MNQRIYVAMDVHLNSVVAVWQKPRGKREKFVIEPTPEGLGRLVEAVGPGEIRAAYEASSCGLEVHDHLQARGWTVWLLAPTHIPRSTAHRKRKTDSEDAHRILDVLVSHGELGTKLPTAWIPPRKIREDRELVRYRLKVGEKLGQVKVEITSLLRIHAVTRPAEFKVPWTRKHLAWLAGLAGEHGALPRSVRLALASQLRVLETLAREVEGLDREVALLAEDPEYQKRVEKMTELDGVGILTAMVFLVELGDVQRFDNRRQVASYLGLVPMSFESGQCQDRKGRITRLGPGRVRKVLNQAAWSLLRKESPWKRWYGQVAARRGGKKAVVGLMRRLGIELWQRARSA